MSKNSRPARRGSPGTSSRCTSGRGHLKDRNPSHAFRRPLPNWQVNRRGDGNTTDTEVTPRRDRSTSAPTRRNTGEMPEKVGAAGVARTPRFQTGPGARPAPASIASAEGSCRPREGRGRGTGKRQPNNATKLPVSPAGPGAAQDPGGVPTVPGQKRGRLPRFPRSLTPRGPGGGENAGKAPSWATCARTPTFSIPHGRRHSTRYRSPLRLPLRQLTMSSRNRCGPFPFTSKL